MAIVALIVGIVSYRIGFKAPENTRYSYKEDNSVDYKVFLKENSFFDSPYLEEGKTYITSLIDYIDADFAYKVSFNNAVSGTIHYQLNAQIRADKKNHEEGNYWTKTFTLVEKQTDVITNRQNYETTLSQKIDYQRFNELLQSFITEYGLSADSTLIVYLDVTGDVRVNDKNDSMDINSKVSLTMPLSELAIEGTIDVNNSNIEKEIITKNAEREKMQLYMKLLFLISIVLFFYFVFQCVLIIKYRTKFFSYRKAVKKICSNYEGMIVRVQNASMKESGVLDVESFEDLVNVYNSIREPINLRYEKDRAVFFIINNGNCYVYTIKKEDFDKK